MNFRLQKIVVAGLFLAACPWLHAADTNSFVVDLPFQANQATPLWLGHPETPQTTFATLNLPITSPDPKASLLVTVYFQENLDGFLRIIWQGTQASQVLSQNFYENIGMSNQRSLLISPETLSGDGKLSFQCGASALNISRIKLEWLEAKPALVSSEIKDTLVTPATGTTQQAQSLDGEPQQPDPAAWHNQIVTVPVTEVPLRIEEGVEFDVQLDQLPAAGRLALKETGLPWGKHMVVWINQKRAGTITPVVPDLLDDGFLTDSPKIYSGWRNGSFYAPVSFFKVGVNALQFSAEDETAPTAETPGNDSPMAIKDVVLQLNYPIAPQAQPASPAPTADASPELHLSVPAAPITTDPTGPAASESSPLSNNLPDTNKP